MKRYLNRIEYISGTKFTIITIFYNVYSKYNITRKGQGKSTRDYRSLTKLRFSFAGQVVIQEVTDSGETESEYEMEDDDADETVEFKSKQTNIGGIEGMAIDVDDYSKGGC